MFFIGCQVGLEPTTLGTTILSSNQLSYRHHKVMFFTHKHFTVLVQPNQSSGKFSLRDSNPHDLHRPPELKSDASTNSAKGE